MSAAEQLLAALGEDRRRRALERMEDTLRAEAQAELEQLLGRAAALQNALEGNGNGSPLPAGEVRFGIPAIVWDDQAGGHYDHHRDHLKGGALDIAPSPVKAAIGRLREHAPEGGIVHDREDGTIRLRYGDATTAVIPADVGTDDRARNLWNHLVTIDAETAPRSSVRPPRQDEAAAPAAATPPPDGGPPSEPPAPPTDTPRPANPLPPNRRVDLDADRVRQAIRELEDLEPRPPITRSEIARHIGVSTKGRVSTRLGKLLEELHHAGRIREAGTWKRGTLWRTADRIGKGEAHQPPGTPHVRREARQEPPTAALEPDPDPDPTEVLQAALDRPRRALEYLQQHGPATAAAIAAALEVESSAMVKVLLGLRDRGRIEDMPGPDGRLWAPTMSPAEQEAALAGTPAALETRQEENPDAALKGEILAALYNGGLRIPQLADRLDRKPTIIAHAVRLLQSAGMVERGAAGVYQRTTASYEQEERARDEE